jgi:hypothetical protein
MKNLVALSRMESKDQLFRYLTIKIDLIREVKKLSKKSREYKDKWYCVQIDNRNTIVSFCQPTLKEVFREIQEEIF